MLIAKVEGAKNIKNFKPISLVGGMYKLILKVLTRRLFSILGEMIEECQHAFVEGRQIFDAVMVAREVVDNLVGNKLNEILCKLDMEKAYDHVPWNFVDYMLDKVGFERLWRK